MKNLEKIKFNENFFLPMKFVCSICVLVNNEIML